MPLRLPNLDDRTFDDLMAQMQSLIPRYSKQWTNHNPSDPGITLLELLVWITEIVLYRLNQVNDRSYLNFLEMLGIQPSGPKVDITFKISVPNKDDLPEDFFINRGTRVAAKDEGTGGELIFETLRTAFRSQGIWDDAQKVWIIKTPAVNTVPVDEEALGISDGAPGQEFQFSQKPVFLDKDDERYQGNPKIFINGAEWIFQRDLLESGHADLHFTVEHLAGLARCGDGRKGKIPDKDSEIVCTYYVLGGEKGNVNEGDITILKDTIPGVDPSNITVTNEYPATGGKESESLADLLERGLRQLQERYRAVSERDFKYLAERTAPEKIARVRVVYDRNLEDTTPVEEGHVSVIVHPSCVYLGLSEESTHVDRSTGELTINHTCDVLRSTFDSNANRLELLKHDILTNLESRRLITTVLHVIFPGFTNEPKFTGITLSISLRPEPGINVLDLRNRVKEKVATFLDPFYGWEDETGWPFGRSVYRSELYQQIEGVEGVDYVEQMLINGFLSNAAVAVAENDLVCIQTLEITVS